MCTEKEKSINEKSNELNNDLILQLEHKLEEKQFKLDRERLVLLMLKKVIALFLDELLETNNTSSLLLDRLEKNIHKCFQDYDFIKKLADNDIEYVYPKLKKIANNFIDEVQQVASKLGKEHKYGQEFVRSRL